MTDAPQQPDDKDLQTARWVGWTLVAALSVVQLYQRIWTGYVPADFSAYLAAADTFAAGHSPYGPALFEASRYGGYVYVYPPGTLWLVGALAGVPSAVATSAAWFARLGALVWIAHRLGRRFALGIPTAILVPTLLLYEPIAADLLGGNLTTYLFAAILAVEWASAADTSKPPSAAVLAAVGAGCGLLIGFKPMWLLPVAWMLWTRRARVFRRTKGRRSLVAGLGGGLAAIGVGTVPLWEHVPVWLERIQAVREQYRSVDLLSLAPPLLPVGLVVWAGAGLWLERRRDSAPSDPADALWLWGCLSLVAWPRLGSYSYVLLLAPLAYLLGRLGARRTLVLALPAFGPLPWLLRPVAEGWWHRALLFGWAWGMAALVGYLLARPSEDSLCSTPP